MAGSHPRLAPGASLGGVAVDPGALLPACGESRQGIRAAARLGRPTLRARRPSRVLGRYADDVALRSALHAVDGWRRAASRRLSRAYRADFCRLRAVPLVAETAKCPRRVDGEIQRERQRTTYDLHKIGGVYLLPVVAILIVTGVLLDMPETFNPMIGRASPLFAPPVCKSVPGPRRISLDAALSAARLRFPDATPRWLETPDGPNGCYRFRLHRRRARFPVSGYDRMGRRLHRRYSRRTRRCRSVNWRYIPRMAASTAQWGSARTIRSHRGACVRARLAAAFRDWNTALAA